MKLKPLLAAAIASQALQVLGAAPSRAQDAPPPAQLAPPAKKNVLFIVSDDLNLDLGCYGNALVKTPHIDRLAARGVRFTNAFCQYPVCNPSRASFLSGLYPETVGVTDNVTPPREAMPNAVFLPGHFKRNGYFAGNAGKVFHYVYDDKPSWHVSEAGNGPRAESLSELLRPQNNAPPPPNVTRAKAERGQDLFWARLDIGDEAMGDGIIARRVAQWMDEKSRERTPFFLAAGFRKPHLPLNVPRKYFELYPLDKIQIPPEPPEHVALLPPLARRLATTIAPLPEAKRREAMQAYYASISFMDAQVGVLLGQMDRSKLWDSTVVVFFSDHGFQLGEHGGLWQKMVMFRESARVPLVIAAPDVKPGVAPGIAELIDIYPTLNELCALPAPPGMALQGVSLLPLLRDPSLPGKRAAFSVVGRGPNPGIGAQLGRSVLTQSSRYTLWPDGTSEFYDHASDPREYRNLAQDPAHAARVAQARALLDAHAQEQKRRARPAARGASAPGARAGDE